MKPVTGAEATAGVVSEPFNLLLYGIAGVGKTTAACEAFFKDGKFSCFFVECESGALKPVAIRLGTVPDHMQDETTKQPVVITGWDALWECFVHVANNRQLYNAMVIDNLSAWTASTEMLLKQQGFGKKNGWEIPVMIRDYLIALRTYARQLGIHIVYLAHARDPYVEDGVFFHGGPSLTPKKASTLFYGAVDTMLRADYMMSQGALVRVFYTGGLEWDQSKHGLQPPSLIQWFQKNREGVQQAVVPADLGLYLRSRKPPYPGL